MLRGGTRANPEEMSSTILLSLCLFGELYTGACPFQGQNIHVVSYPAPTSFEG